MAGVLIRTAQAMGAYDDDPAEVRQVLKDLRSQD